MLVLAATALLGSAALLVAPTVGWSAPLSSQIESTRGELSQKRQRAGVLTETLSTYGNRIQALQGEIRGLEARQSGLELRLNAKLAELARVRVKLERTRARLRRLTKRLAVSEAALADRLVELYKADEPDALTVLLESDGFVDLLERSDFLERVSEQDQRIVKRVRRLRAAAKRQTVELAALERREQAAAAEIRTRRDQVAAAKGKLVRTRDGLAQARATRRSLLGRVRAGSARLEGDLSGLLAQQKRVRTRLQSASAEPSLPAGPVRKGSGGLIWGVSGPVVSPFGTRWGRLHAGVDIAVPAGTPIRAAAAGRVVTMGPQGGYGNYTCIQHQGALQTCYAHQSSFATSPGAQVSQGQVIGSVGCTGTCSGDHLHFEVRTNGSPVDPMAYL